MKKMLTGECHPDNIFELVDPTSFLLEIDFEAEVVKALTCLLPDYMCGSFAGSFVLEGKRRSADLALIHKNFSHWFVVEVELAGHSFENHVLPQVRCFRYGDPDASCVTSLTRGFSELTRDHAQALLRHIPRYVAVVSNIFDPLWHSALMGLDVALLSVSVYRRTDSKQAYTVEGKLNIQRESLGFSQFSVTDNSIRLPKSCGLPLGLIQIEDEFGSLSEWYIREAGETLWVTKERGYSLLPHGSYVQVLRNFDGLISIRPAYNAAV